MCHFYMRIKYRPKDVEGGSTVDDEFESIGGGPTHFLLRAIRFDL